nr:helix-turn-helix transcriptional regulator [Paracoccus saliphilus]
MSDHPQAESVPLEDMAAAMGLRTARARVLCARTGALFGGDAVDVQTLFDALGLSAASARSFWAGRPIFLTAAELAQQRGVSTRTISNHVNGRGTPSDFPRHIMLTPHDMVFVADDVADALYHVPGVCAPHHAAPAPHAPPDAADGWNHFTGNHELCVDLDALIPAPPKRKRARKK